MSIFTYTENLALWERETLSEKIERVLNGYVELFSEINNEDLKRDAETIVYHIKDPYTLIVLGEVKAGKSSFINALLSPLDPVCKTGRKPTTEIVQKFKHGEKKETKQISSTYRETTLPKEILKHVSVIDTPGINVIAEGHQQVTESVLSAADLIFLVFNVMNAFSKTTWELHKEIVEKWKPEGIVILQMKDLVPDDELDESTEYLNEYMDDRLEKRLKIFPVSAKLEIEKAKGKKNEEDSGFEELTKYIQKSAMETAYYTKLQRLVDRSFYLSNSAEAYIEKERQAILEADTFRNTVNEEIKRGREKYEESMQDVIQEILRAYDEETVEGREEIRKGLSMYHLSARSTWSSFAGGVSNEEWVRSELEKVEVAILSRCTPMLERKLPRLAEDIENMVHRVHMEIRLQGNIMAEHENPDFGGIQAIQEMNKNYTNLNDKIEPAIDGFKHGGIHFGDAGDTVAGMGLGVGSIVLAFTLHNALFVLGPIAIPPLLLWKKRSLLVDVDKALKHARKGVEENLNEKFNESLTTVVGYIDEVFEEFDQDLALKKEALAKVEEKQKEFEKMLEHIKKEAESKKNKKRGWF